MSPPKKVYLNLCLFITRNTQIQCGSRTFTLAVYSVRRAKTNTVLTVQRSDIRQTFGNSHYNAIRFSRNINCSLQSNHRIVRIQNRSPMCQSWCEVCARHDANDAKAFFKHPFSHVAFAAHRGGGVGGALNYLN